MKRILLSLLLALCLLLSACALPPVEEGGGTSAATETKTAEKGAPLSFEMDSDPVSDFTLPEYTSSPYAVLNGNKPYFSDSEMTGVSFEYYSEQDSLGRCGVAVASVGKDLMPTEERGSIGQVKPSGWHTVKYDCVDGKYLYNRCHLIGFQLSGENANPSNLITGTRYMNVEGMLPFENMVADFVKETGMHVMLRVTPYFVGTELLARGVIMEAKSVEDNGEGIEFCVFCFNVQPGVEIQYATGESQLAETPAIPQEPTVQTRYILNTNTKKIHYPSCSSAAKIAEKNRKESTESVEALKRMGYEPCKNCF